jgi:hypothetical protein
MWVFVTEKEHDFCQVFYIVQFNRQLQQGKVWFLYGFGIIRNGLLVNVK